MKKIVQWLQVNRLSLNINKTHHMVFTPKAKQSTPVARIVIQGVELTQVEDCKFLGVLLDNKFNWKKHTKYVANKIAKSIGIISKTKKYLTQKSTLSLYYSFIYPMMLYCNLAWGSTSQANLWCIFKLQ